MRKQVVINWGLYWFCDHLGTASDLVKTVSNSLHEFSGGNIVFRAHTIEIKLAIDHQRKSTIKTYSLPWMARAKSLVMMLLFSTVPTHACSK